MHAPLLPTVFLTLASTAVALAQDSPPGTLPGPFPAATLHELIDFEPAMTVREDPATGDLVEEHRQDGVLYMVRVRSGDRPAYMLLDTDGNGRIDAIDGEAPHDPPAYWTRYAWE